MEAKPFKSPRKVEEELKVYRNQRFESYMAMADRGELTRALAIAAFRDELDGNPCLTVVEGADNDSQSESRQA